MPRIDGIMNTSSRFCVRVGFLEMLRYRTTNNVTALVKTPSGG